MTDIRKTKKNIIIVANDFNISLCICAEAKDVATY